MSGGSAWQKSPLTNGAIWSIAARPNVLKITNLRIVSIVVHIHYTHRGVHNVADSWFVCEKVHEFQFNLVIPGLHFWCFLFWIIKVGESISFMQKGTSMIKLRTASKKYIRTYSLDKNSTTISWAPSKKGDRAKSKWECSYVCVYPKNRGFCY